MKRRYKQGDWFRVPLGGECDAIGVIASADRSRLFGYFFTIAHDAEANAEQLKQLRAADSFLHAHFGGAALEEHRWHTIASSLTFDPDAWPVPSSGERRFVTPLQLEAMLHARIAGEAPEVPLAVYELRSPIDETALQFLAGGGRAQFSEPLTERDLDVLAAFIEQSPHVELRVHGGWANGFDLRSLARFRALRSLVIDVLHARNEEALKMLAGIRAMRIGASWQPQSLRTLQSLTNLHTLELHGRTADVATVESLAALHDLRLVDTNAIAFERMASRTQLRRLTLGYGRYDLAGITALPSLEHLGLASMQLQCLPDFSQNPKLQSVTLRDIRGMRDLLPLMRATQLRDLTIAEMPQLEVWDFQPLRDGWTKPPSISIDVGSRTKSREVYRLLCKGRTFV